MTDVVWSRINTKYNTLVILLFKELWQKRLHSWYSWWHDDWHHTNNSNQMSCLCFCWKNLKDSSIYHLLKVSWNIIIQNETVVNLGDHCKPMEIVHMCQRQSSILAPVILIYWDIHAYIFPVVLKFLHTWRLLSKNKNTVMHTSM